MGFVNITSSLAAAALLASAGLHVPASALGMPTSQQQQLNAVFSDLNSTTPGCVVGVVRDGTLTYARAFGMADLAQHVPMATHTVVEIGSLSKQFTAASILLLAQGGRLSLNDPVRQYVRELPNYGASPTIGELLHHTSGIRDVITLMKLSGIPVTDSATQADALAMIERQQHLNFFPGTEYEYSNSGYVLLAAVVSRVTGEELPVFESDQIFKPLGMTHTFIDTDPSAVIRGRARSYRLGADHAYRLDDSNWVQFGDGAVNTTIGDFALWVGNLQHPLVGGTQLVRALETRGRFLDGDVTDYAGGLFVDSYRGLPRVSHSGAWQGFRTDFALFPQQHLALITLCNGADTHPEERTQKMADIILGNRLVSANTDRDSAISLQLARNVGWYASLDHLQLWHVAVRHGRALMGPAGDEAGRWRGGAAPDSFISTAGTVRFFQKEGRRRLQLDRFGEALTRLPPPGKTELQDPSGEYTSSALQVTWKIVANDGHILLDMRGANPNRLDTDQVRRLHVVAAGIYAAGSVTLEFGANEFWVFAPRAGGIHFVRQKRTRALVGTGS